MVQYSPMGTIIELLGGECTGKSTLAAEIARELGAQIVPEELRAFVDERRRTPRADEQRDIMERQSRSLASVIEQAGTQSVIVCDPSPVMTAVYSIQYFDDDSLLRSALDLTHGTDLIVWCHPDIPWTPDGLHHDGPLVRERTHEILTQHVLPELADRPVIEVRGTPGERLDAVLRSLRR